DEAPPSSPPPPARRQGRRGRAGRRRLLRRPPRALPRGRPRPHGEGGGIRLGDMGGPPLGELLGVGRRAPRLVVPATPRGPRAPLRLGVGRGGGDRRAPLCARPREAGRARRLRRPGAPPSPCGGRRRLPALGEGAPVAPVAARRGPGRERALPRGGG